MYSFLHSEEKISIEHFLCTVPGPESIMHVIRLEDSARGLGISQCHHCVPSTRYNTLSTFAKRREKEGRGSILLRRTHTRASLLAQWQRLQETWVQSLIHSTC